MFCLPFIGCFALHFSDALPSIVWTFANSAESPSCGCSYRTTPPPRLDIHRVLFPDEDDSDGISEQDEVLERVENMLSESDGEDAGAVVVKQEVAESSSKKVGKRKAALNK
jgi:hypothetical protein